MCGIIAISATAGQMPDVSGMLQTLYHRGPDDSGILEFVANGSSRIALGHRRLSIIDTSQGGHQPMVTRDGRFAITYNGEIYNYIELRNELRLLGQSFTTESDTEVLLAAWAQWGITAINRLVGMFAFAIYDTQLATLTFVRDNFGIKPLYFCKWSGGVAAASEIAPLLDLPGTNRELDRQAIYDYLVFGATDHGTSTIYQSIQQLLPGEYATLDIATGGLKKDTYWRAAAREENKISFSEALQGTRERFLKNIELHMRSDVPLGFCISGGIDSSAILCGARHLYPDAEIHGFTYDSGERETSELHWAKMAAEAANAKLHIVRISPEELIGDLPRLLAHQGEPFGSTGIYAQFRVFQAARESGIKVMLDGQGADELFAGYRFYRAVGVADRLLSGNIAGAMKLAGGDTTRSDLLRVVQYLLPNQLGHNLRWLGGKPHYPSWIRRGWFSDAGVGAHATTISRSEKTNLKDALRASLSGENLVHLLRYEDRNSMAHSLESRVPFLTADFADWALSLPSSYMLTDEGVHKAVFREAMRGIVPDAILDRKDKVGFATPEASWLDVLKPWVDELLNGAAGSAIINANALRLEYEGVLQGHRKFGWHIWRCLNLLAMMDGVGLPAASVQ